MATDPATMAFLLDQMAGAGHVTSRRMFGEYAVYLNGKVVGFVCDDTLFLKPVPTARALLAAPEDGFPYPGAKPHLKVTAEVDDPDTLAALLRAVAAGLPDPAPKKPKPPKGR